MKNSFRNEIEDTMFCFDRFPEVGKVVAQRLKKMPHTLEVIDEDEFGVTFQVTTEDGTTFQVSKLQLLDTVKSIVIRHLIPDNFIFVSKKHHPEILQIMDEVFTLGDKK